CAHVAAVDRDVEVRVPRGGRLGLAPQEPAVEGEGDLPRLGREVRGGWLRSMPVNVRLAEQRGGYGRDLGRRPAEDRAFGDTDLRRRDLLPGKLATEERLPPQGRVALAELNHLADEALEVLVLLRQRPVHPARLVVLAPGIVVPLLSSQKFVPSGEHWDSLGKQERGDEVLRLPGAEGENLRVGSFALDAAVPGVILVPAVAVAFAVLLVVLQVVTDQVPEREAVVTGDVVDRVPRQPAVPMIAVRGAGEARAELA